MESNFDWQKSTGDPSVLGLWMNYNKQIWFHWNNSPPCRIATYIPSASSNQSTGYWECLSLNWMNFVSLCDWWPQKPHFIYISILPQELVNKNAILVFKDWKKVRFIKIDISPIKIVVFWKKLFEMPCQFSFIFQYIVNSKPTIFNFPLWLKYDKKITGHI